jgi:hypothetical protein
MRLTLAFAVCVTIAASPAAHALTVNEVIARHIDARGGLAKLRAVQTLRLTGKLLLSHEEGRVLEASWGQIYQRNNKTRIEFTLQGLTDVDAYDGHEAWHFSPFQGRREAERTTEDETALLAADADFEGPLVDWREKGHVVEYLGTEDVDGTEAHKLRVTRKNGNIDYVYLDPDTFLLIRTLQVARVRGAEHVVETDFGSYEQVAGVWFPFSIDAGPQNAPRDARIVVERAEVNVTVDKPPSAIRKRARRSLAWPSPARQRRARPRRRHRRCPRRARRSSMPASSPASARATSAQPR